MEIGTFELKKTEGAARRGAFQTAHGSRSDPSSRERGHGGVIMSAR